MFVALVQSQLGAGRFVPGKVPSVPHMGWNGVTVVKESQVLTQDFEDGFFYFVHSYRAMPEKAIEDWFATFFRLSPLIQAVWVN